MDYLAAHQTRQVRKSRSIHAGAVGQRFVGWEYPLPMHAIDPDQPGELGAWNTLCGLTVSWAEGRFQILSTSCRDCYELVVAARRDAVDD